MRPEIISYKAQTPWYGGDLQTLRNTILGDEGDLSDWKTKRFNFLMPDGSGDRLYAAFNKPLPTTNSANNKTLVILIHGMSGSENSSTIKKSAQFYLEQGFPTLRLNLRGAGAFRKSARGTYHAGRSEDLGEVLSQLNANLADQCFLVGHSLGGNMLIKAVSEIGVKINSNIPILGAASLCAPFNMVESAVKFSRRRNYVYQNSIFSHIKASLSSVDGISERQLERIHAFKTLRELDDTVVAPSLGLSDAKQYYEKYSACKFAADAKVPLLISTALDDPWVCAKAYLDFDWSQNSNLIPAITKTGGHCGFHEKGHTSTWFDRRVAQLIDTLS